MSNFWVEKNKGESTVYSGSLGNGEVTVVSVQNPRFLTTIFHFHGLAMR